MEHDVDLSELQGPEAAEAQALIASMISAQPERRLSALQVFAVFFNFFLPVGVRHSWILTYRNAGLSPSILLGTSNSPAVYTFSI